MQIIYNNDLKNKVFLKTTVALGSFEALHAGHLKIIEKTVACAKSNNLESVITIFKNPILKNRNTVCETLEERLGIIKNTGADTVVIFDFNEEFRTLGYTEFFNKYIIEIFNAKHVFTGFNYRFGNGALGDNDILSFLCKERKIIHDITPPIAFDEIVSSTHIYNLIKKGDAKKLNDLLLRPYSITGAVTTGRKIGHKLGFPTANIEFPENKAILKNGVYFGYAETVYGVSYAIINVGTQPTVSDVNTPKIEAFLLDFNEDIYGEKIKINFLEYIRDIKKFNDINELKNQLNLDKKIAEKLKENIKANT